MWEEKNANLRDRIFGWNLKKLWSSNVATVSTIIWIGKKFVSLFSQRAFAVRRYVATINKDPGGFRARRNQKHALGLSLIDQTIGDDWLRYFHNVEKIDVIRMLRALLADVVNLKGVNMQVSANGLLYEEKNHWSVEFYSPLPDWKICSQQYWAGVDLDKSHLLSLREFWRPVHCRLRNHRECSRPDIFPQLASK